MCGVVCDWHSAWGYKVGKKHDTVTAAFGAYASCVCVCVCAFDSQCHRDKQGVTAVTLQASLTDYLCVAPCRPEEELWAGAAGAGGATGAGGAPAVSPPGGHAGCRGRSHPPPHPHSRCFSRFPFNVFDKSNSLGSFSSFYSSTSKPSDR